MPESWNLPSGELLTDFVDDLLHHGQATLSPGIAVDSPLARELLSSAFSTYRLSIAGPEIPFDPDVAVQAALTVRAACVALVDRGERAESLGPQLQMPLKPSTPSDHLSADLLFRFLPQVLRRIRGLDPDDPVIVMIETLLRGWPLSGVLAEIEYPPSTTLDFCGHPGLCLLYSERLAHHERPSWYPEGTAAEYWQLVRATPTR